MRDDNAIALMVLLLVIVLVGVAQSRFDTCRSEGHKTLACVFFLE
jgi:hypothetical protein